MPADPAVAGRKGGSRNTPAQQAARKKNGFQKRAQEVFNETGGQHYFPSALPAPEPQRPTVLIPAQPKEGQ
jgi:hypothetical protein